MSKHSFFLLPVSGSQGTALILTISIVLGLSMGAWFSGSAGEYVVSGMRAVVSSRVSIIGLLSSLMLPLLVSGFVVYIRQSRLLFPIAFFKAFLFSCPFCALVSVWGSAGWLIAGLVMAQSACSMPVLCWYWMRHAGGQRFDAVTFGLTAAALGMIGILNDCFIVPFLASIITF